MQTLNIIKIGGNVIDNDLLLSQFLLDFSKIAAPKILVHGGGKLATDYANKLHLKQTLIDGRRVTDVATLEITVMIYAGLINKKIVAQLQANNTNAIGFTGADANLITSKKRDNSTIDFGFVGDVVNVNDYQINQFLENDLTPVFCAITHDEKGNLLNTNADTIVTKIAVAMSKNYKTNLVFCFEKPGVLSDPNDDNSVINDINIEYYQELKNQKIISDGMIPKLDNAFQAINHGVEKVLICHAKNMSTISNQYIGTQLIK